MGRDDRLNPFGRRSMMPAASIVRERYNRVIHEGDQIYVGVPGIVQQPYTVEAIKPVEDPSIPGGHHMLEVTVRSRLRFHCEKDQISDVFVLIRTAAEQEAANPQPQPPAEPPPPPPPTDGGESFTEMRERLRKDLASAPAGGPEDFPSETPTPKEEVQ